MASHAACGIHPPTSRSRTFSVVSLQGRLTRPSREGSARVHFRGSHSCGSVQRGLAGPWAGPWQWGWTWGVGLGALGGVMGTGGSGGPGGVLVVLRLGDARGVGGARAYADTWTRRRRLCLGAWLGSRLAAVTGHLLDLGRH